MAAATSAKTVAAPRAAVRSSTQHDFLQGTARRALCFLDAVMGAPMAFVPCSSGRTGTFQTVSLPDGDKNRSGSSDRRLSSKAGHKIQKGPGSEPLSAKPQFTPSRKLRDITITPGKNQDHLACIRANGMPCALNLLTMIQLHVNAGLKKELQLVGSM